MTQRYWLSLVSIPLWLTLPHWGVVASPVSTTIAASRLTQATQKGRPDAVMISQQTCDRPVLSQLSKHQVVAGETLESIARQYDLIPATLMGMNPAVRSGKVATGSELVVPPYNGIRVEVPAGRTWRDVAATYKVRADVLFEVNGCQTAPKVVFVPGVNWSPNVSTKPGATSPSLSTKILTGYPLPKNTPVLLGYGWQLQPATGQVAFHGGVDLEAKVGTPVLAVGDGVIAFAGNQGNYGKLVVINHQQGQQTRYAQLSKITVKVGQTVRRGETIALTGMTGRPSSPEPHLHFEVRSNSKLGWVAENPERYLPGRTQAER